MSPSRFTPQPTAAWRAGKLSRALVIGEQLCAGIDASLLAGLAATVVVDVEGMPRARGLSGAVATGPLASLAALYAHAAERGIVFR